MKLNSSKKFLISVVLTLVAISGGILLVRQKTLFHSAAPDVGQAIPSLKSMGKMPLYFVENKGQTDGQVDYYLSGKDKSIYFTPQGAIFSLNEKLKQKPREQKKPENFTNPHDQEAPLKSWKVKLDYLGANADIRPVPGNPMKTKINYLKGPKKNWKTGIGTYASIAYKVLWPGIDLTYSGQTDKLEYKFTVAPGSDPKQIQLAYSGAQSVTLSSDGGLNVSTPAGSFIDEAPLAYQEKDGKRQMVDASYNLEQNPPGGQVRFAFNVGTYDKTLPLIIDPSVIIYAGFIGGSDYDYPDGIAVDSGGNAIITGLTNSTDIPVTDSSPYGGGYDILLVKVDPAGTLLYASYFGGSAEDEAFGIAVDSGDNAIIVGRTYSSDFPVTSGAVFGGVADAFVAKVNPVGTLVYAKYLGGSAHEEADHIALDSNGDAIIVGGTQSSDFPVTNGSAMDGSGDNFVAKILSADGSVDYSTYLGASGSAITSIVVDSNGDAIIAGFTHSSHFPVTNGSVFGGGIYDAYIAKILSSDGSIGYAAYLGGSGDDFSYSKSLAVDPNGDATITGFTDSPNFPVTNGTVYGGSGNHTFVAKILSSGSIGYTTYLGGSSGDIPQGIVLDSNDDAIITGLTQSSDFPVTDGSTLDGFGDAYVAKILSADGSIGYATYIGGSGDDEAEGIALDANDNIIIAGYTDSSDFPVTDGSSFGGVSDIFVTKILSADHSIDYAGYIGGSGEEDFIGSSVDGIGNYYITGFTQSSDFSAIAGPDLTYNDDGSFGDIFVAKIGLGSVCGDGIIAGAEQCDDGNVLPGDGCDASCQIECAPAGSGLVSWWKGGNDANDSNGTNHGTLQNGATFATGKVGQAFSLDGVDDGVQIPDSTSLRPTQMTVDAWVNTTLVPSSPEIIVDRIDPTTGYDGYTLQLDYGAGAGFLRFNVLGAPGTLVSLDGTSNIADGVWHHVAGTYDGSQVCVYVDGVQQACAPYADGVQYVTGNDTYIGVRDPSFVSGTWTPWSGKIDEVQIFSTALSPSEIQKIYNAGAVGSCPLACGDGVVSSALSEQCDDGNLINGDGCESDCTVTPICPGNPGRVKVSGSCHDFDGDQSSCENAWIQGGSGIASCWYDATNLVGHGPNKCEGCGNNNLNNGFCTNACALCGDSIVEAGEQCDDGNINNSDGCSSTCHFECLGAPARVQVTVNCHDFDGNQASCENAWINGGSGITSCWYDATNLVGHGLNKCEGCGSSNLNNGFCANSCALCGDNTVEAGEQCDDGNVANGDGCDSNCTVTACGNGVITSGEQCDDGNNNDGDGCSSACMIQVCGNGVVESGETCDDGNTTDAGTCNADCTALTACGDGTVQDPNGNGDSEQCDDGNNNDGDGCSSACMIQVCGNGVVESGETCDDGNTTDAGTCNADCTALTACGDGTVQDPNGNGDSEQCDDGNNNDGDGCSSACMIQVCGNGVVESGETCDDGNTTDAGTCNADCTALTACGDGTVQDPNGNGDSEQCDDGNLISGDGCDAVCVAEPAQIEQNSVRWRNDDGNESAATFAADENAALTSLSKNESKRLRFGLASTGLEVGPVRKDAVSTSYFDGETTYGAGIIAPDHHFAYFLNTTSSDAPLVKFDLTTFTRTDAIHVVSSGGGTRAAVMDPSGDFAYFGSNLFGGVVSKVDLSTFTIVDTLDPGASYLYTAVIDPLNHFAYFGTYEGKIIKINLSTFTVEDTLQTTEGMPLLTSVIDPANGFAYFGADNPSYASGDAIIKIDLSTFQEVDAVTLHTGEYDIRSSVADTAGGFAYFGSGSGEVNKVNISPSNFSEADSLSAASGSLTSAVIDPASGAAYFGTGTVPGNVVKIDLNSFTQTGVIQLENGEDYLMAGVIDPDNEYAYFGGYTSVGFGGSGKIVRISLAPHYQFRLEYGENISTCGAIGSWTQVPAVAGSEAFVMTPVGVPNSTPTIHNDGLTAGNVVFHSGLVMSGSSESPDILLGPQEYTEYEYGLKATASALDGGDYCFRLTNAGMGGLFAYTNYAEATLAAPPATSVGGGHPAAPPSAPLGSSESTPQTSTFDLTLNLKVKVKNSRDDAIAKKVEAVISTTSNSALRSVNRNDVKTFDAIDANESLKQNILSGSDIASQIKGQSETFSLNIWRKGTRTSPVATKIVTTNLFGEVRVTIPGFSPGYYDFTLETPNALRAAVNDQFVNVTPYTLDFTHGTGKELKFGDFNGDNRIDLLDLSAVIGNYKSKDPAKHAAIDFTEDGHFDLADFAVLIKNWGAGD